MLMDKIDAVTSLGLVDSKRKFRLLRSTFQTSFTEKCLEPGTDLSVSCYQEGGRFSIERSASSESMVIPCSESSDTFTDQLTDQIRQEESSPLSSPQQPLPSSSPSSSSATSSLCRKRFHNISNVRRASHEDTNNSPLLAKSVNDETIFLSQQSFSTSISSTEHDTLSPGMYIKQKQMNCFFSHLRKSCMCVKWSSIRSFRHHIKHTTCRLHLMFHSMYLYACLCRMFSMGMRRPFVPELSPYNK